MATDGGRRLERWAPSHPGVHTSLSILVRVRLFCSLLQVNRRPFSLISLRHKRCLSILLMQGILPRERERERKQNLTSDGITLHHSFSYWRKFHESHKALFVATLFSRQEHPRISSHQLCAPANIETWRYQHLLPLISCTTYLYICKQGVLAWDVLVSSSCTNETTHPSSSCDPPALGTNDAPEQNSCLPSQWYCVFTRLAPGICFEPPQFSVQKSIGTSCHQLD